nr:MAG TPA: hypothetical protein [Caudoviricetes sp.]
MKYGGRHDAVPVFLSTFCLQDTMIRLLCCYFIFT